MSDDFKVDTFGLTELQNQLINETIRLFPEELKKFLKKNASTLQKRTKIRAKAELGKKTGNYLKGFKVSKAFVGEGRGYIKVYNSMPHAHLIEYGHKKWIRGKDTGEYVKGRFILAKEADAFINEYYKNAQSFLEEYFDEAI